MKNFPANQSILASLLTMVRPHLVAIGLWGHVCLEGSPAFKFRHEPELPRACTSKGVGHLLFELQPLTTETYVLT